MAEGIGDSIEQFRRSLRKNELESSEVRFQRQKVQNTAQLLNDMTVKIHLSESIESLP